MKKSLILRVENVSKKYRKVTALDDFSLDVSSGTIFSLLGPNGAGKTTLMKIVLGLVEPDTGSVELQGRSVSSPLSREGVRYLPENVRFPSWATPAVMFRQLERIRRESDRSEFRVRCSQLECGHLMKRPMGKMSRGQRQRVALALVTCGSPATVFLDEPSSGLDPGGRILVRNLIGELADAGTSVLINSHLLGEVERVCHRAAFINRGHLITEGSLEKLSRHKGKVIVETGDSKSMLRALQSQDYSCRMEFGGVTVSLTETDEFEPIVRAALNTGVEFSGISRMRENLEDVFLRIMGDDEAEEAENGVS